MLKSPSSDVLALAELSSGPRALVCVFSLLMSSRLKRAGHVERMGDEKLVRGREKEATKTELANGRIALRQIWKELEENGEPQQNIELGTVDRELSERKVRKENTKRRW